MLDVAELESMAKEINNTSWLYEPTVRELKAIKKLRDTLTEYLDYLNDTTIKRGRDVGQRVTCNHCGEVLNPNGTCPGLCTPSERD